MGLRLIQYRGKKTTKNKTAHKGAPNSVALLNSQAPCFGPKIREIWIFFSPLIFTYINQSVLCSTNLALKRNYDSINQTCVMLIGKTGFSVFLIQISTI